MNLKFFFLFQNVYKVHNLLFLHTGNLLYFIRVMAKIVNLDYCCCCCYSHRKKWIWIWNEMFVVAVVLFFIRINQIIHDWNKWIVCWHFVYGFSFISNPINFLCLSEKKFVWIFPIQWLMILIDCIIITLFIVEMILFSSFRKFHFILIIDIHPKCIMDYQIGYWMSKSKTIDRLKRTFTLTHSDFVNNEEKKISLDNQDLA